MKKWERGEFYRKIGNLSSLLQSLVVAAEEQDAEKVRDYGSDIIRMYRDRLWQCYELKGVINNLKDGVVKSEKGGITNGSSK